MNNVAGVVVLYYPDYINIVRNICSYIDHLSVLLIIDNTPGGNQELVEKISALNKPILFKSNASNDGIAKPLNYAAEWAIKKNCTWLLTMDQDSYFDAIQISNYVEWIHTKSPENLAIAGINFDSARGEQVSGEIEVSPVSKVITSGSMVNLKYWQALNGFDEKLFIDEVDHEYCYRAITNGYLVCKLLNVTMHHQMGRSVVAGYFGVFAKQARMIHSPLRIYYMVRNYLYTRKNYSKLMPAEFEVRDGEIKTILKNNLFFSGKLFPTLGMAFRGWLDYRKGIFGKYT